MSGLKSQLRLTNSSQLTSSLREAIKDKFSVSPLILPWPPKKGARGPGLTCIGLSLCPVVTSLSTTHMWTRRNSSSSLSFTISSANSEILKAGNILLEVKKNCFNISGPAPRGPGDWKWPPDLWAGVSLLLCRPPDLL